MRSCELAHLTPFLCLCHLALSIFYLALVIVGNVHNCLEVDGQRRIEGMREIFTLFASNFPLKRGLRLKLRIENPDVSPMKVILILYLSLTQVEPSLRAISEVHGPLYPPNSNHSGPERGICNGLCTRCAPGYDCHSGGPSHRSQCPHLYHSPRSVYTFSNCLLTRCSRFISFC